MFFSKNILKTSCDVSGGYRKGTSVIGTCFFGDGGEVKKIVYKKL